MNILSRYGEELKDVDTLKLQLNFDGATIGKKSSYSFWPLLATISGKDNNMNFLKKSGIANQYFLLYKSMNKYYLSKILKSSCNCLHHSMHKDSP